MMPDPADNMRKLFAYLCKTRKIPATIVEELVHAGLLYQSAKFGNAVFVHQDAQGKAIGAEIQGTNSYKRYKGMAAGTGESVFRFMPFPSGINAKPLRAFLFESAIDLMKTGMNYYLKTLGVYALQTVVIGFWSMFLIIPGVIAALNFSQAFFILADDPEKSITQVLAESKIMMYGNKMNYLRLLIYYIPYIMLAYVPAFILAACLLVAGRY